MSKALIRMKQLIKDYKRNTGKKEKDLAEELGMSPEYLSRIKRGIYNNAIPVKQAHKMAEFFDVRYEWIMGLDDYETEEEKEDPKAKISLKTPVAEIKISNKDLERSGYFEVVRCKDCEFYYEDERWCRRLGLCGAFDADGYCAHGERREDNAGE